MCRTLIIALLSLTPSCSKSGAVSCGSGTVLRADTCVATATSTTMSGAVQPIAASGAVQPSTAPTSNTTSTDLYALMRTRSLTEAIELVRPLMSDAQDSWSEGGLELAMWASSRLRWQEVAISKNETSVALIQKDSDEARGKRMCTSGQLIQIAKQNAGGQRLYTGVLMSDYRHLISFYVAGDTGELVERSRTRLCGVVIGTFDYANSGGGQGHAVAVVGMFDLPKNKTP